jgi:hypothetical protein
MASILLAAERTADARRVRYGLGPATSGKKLELVADTARKVWG